MQEIFTDTLQEGMRFSAPVFFDDGKNMFLAERKKLKKFHLAAIRRWKITYVTTWGHQLASAECAELDRKEAEQIVVSEADDLECL